MSLLLSDVTCIDVSRKGDLICAGSADMTFKVVNRESFKDVLFDGHSAPVLSVAFNAAADVVASSSCDGSVKLWSVNDKRCLKTWSNLWKMSNDAMTSESRGVVSWNFSTPEVAIPTKDSVKVSLLRNFFFFH
jgi:chromosome transmission fidelity protein 4